MPIEEIVPEGLQLRHSQGYGMQVELQVAQGYPSRNTKLISKEKGSNNQRSGRDNHSLFVVENHYSYHSFV